MKIAETYSHLNGLEFLIVHKPTLWKEIQEVIAEVDTRAARKTCPKSLWPSARRKLDQLNRVRTLAELAVPPGNRLERLQRDRSGQHSIRLNDQYRVCFRWENEYADHVEITDYH